MTDPTKNRTHPDNPCGVMHPHAPTSLCDGSEWPPAAPSPRQDPEPLPPYSQEEIARLSKAAGTDLVRNHPAVKALTEYALAGGYENYRRLLIAIVGLIAPSPLPSREEADRVYEAIFLAGYHAGRGCGSPKTEERARAALRRLIPCRGDDK